MTPDVRTGVSGVGSRVSGVRDTHPTPDRAERLRATARQLEGVFVEQMFKAMRETVPDGGAVSGGSGEAMFIGMLDQSIAEEVPARWSNGLAEALYRQLQRAAGIDGGADAAAAPSSPPPALPILDAGTSTSAARARAVLTEPR